MRHLKVLLAEDDAAHCELLLAAIRCGGAEVSVTTVTGREALLNAAREQPHDCIILDFNLPPHTAPELVRDLGEIGLEQPPIIVISSSEDQAVVIRAIREGVADFVPKLEAVRGTTLWDRINEVVARARRFYCERRRTNRRLQFFENQARRDALTGLSNRWWTERVIRLAAGEGTRRRTAAVIMIDLDHFKRVNDTFGHDVGDEVLRSVADVLRSQSKSSDTVGRWGGEEFVVIRASESLTDAWIWTDDVRAHIGAEVMIPGNAWRQTVSCGVDVLPIESLEEHGVHRADLAMYLAKESGRDRVCTWDMASTMEVARNLGSEVHLESSDRAQRLLSRLADALGATQCDHTGPHGARVRRIVLAVAAQLGLDEDQCRALAMAASFHDIGKVAIPEPLLSLSRALTPGERRFIDEHARFGAELLAACGAEPAVVEAVAQHHTRYDKYPAEEPPRLASVLCAADAMDAMLSVRPYCQPRSLDQALRELQQESGRQFTPDVVEALDALSARVTGA